MAKWLRCTSKEIEIREIAGWPECHTSHRDWLLWQSTWLVSFAVLETRGIMSQNHPTYSHVVRYYVRKSKWHKAATGLAIMSFAMWWTYHVIWED